MLGNVVSHYRVLEQLGAGNMGIVYKAEDLKLGRNVALKFLSERLARDEASIGRFRREARSASALNHPNICTIYDIDQGVPQPGGPGNKEPVHFIVMEFLEGVTLERHINGKSLPLDWILELAIQITDALDLTRIRGVIHRDIKPANLFITDRGEAKILDFGLAKLTIQVKKADSTSQNLSWSKPGFTVGTLPYMSPEQLKSEDLDSRTDLFSFGAVLYEMATGRAAFAERSVAETYVAVLDKTPESPRRINPAIPNALEHIITKALEKDADVRYQYAAEMRADLRRLKRDLDSGQSFLALPVSSSAVAEAPTTAIPTDPMVLHGPGILMLAPMHRWAWILIIMGIVAMAVASALLLSS